MRAQSNINRRPNGFAYGTNHKMPQPGNIGPHGGLLAFGQKLAAGQHISRKDTDTKPLSQRLMDKFMLGNAVVVFSSGMMLTASGLLSLLPPTGTAGKPAISGHASSPPKHSSIFEYSLKELQELLSSIGWKMASIAMGTSGSSMAMTGYRTRQESLMLGGLASLGGAAWLAVDPSIVAKALLFASYAMRTVGMGNTLQDKYYPLQPGEKARETSLETIFNPKRLKEIAPDAGSGKLMALWLKDVGKSFKAVITDHGLMLKNSAVTIYDAGTYIITHPKDLTARSLKSAVEVAELVTGKRNDAPSLPKPNAKQNHLAASLMYVSSLPVLALQGSAADITQYLSVLFGMGITLNMFSLFSMGVQEKDPSQRSMIYGVPLIAGGNMFPYNDLGTGIAFLGATTTQLAARKWGQNSKATPIDEKTARSNEKQ